MHSVKPLVEQLPARLSSEQAFRCLAHLPHVVFFDSAQQDTQLGRWSFVAADPFHWLEVPADGSDALALLKSDLAKYAVDSLPGLPPFQGGAAGLFGYELLHSLEQVPRAKHDEFQVPALAVGFYDVVVAFDHQQNTAWLISQGFPETGSAARQSRSAQRLSQFRDLLSGPPQVNPVISTTPLACDLANQFPISSNPDLTSNFSADGYRSAVAKGIELIHAGDIFQVNLSHRLLHPATTDSLSLYLRLRERNAAPFAGYFDTGTFQICSASPERFLAVRDGKVETRPIKGTRSRGMSPEADLFAGDDLKLSEKDRAENVMIVDLLRNDLSRICEPDSVHVSQLCALENYAFVQHLVSVVCGKLRPGCTALDQFRAAFPGGSITGAPKVRAMEIISEIEPTTRGAYCGSLGYIGFDGNADSSILIRTITAGRGWWQMPVGGGIVADSDPQSEYEETWHKANGMLRALEP